MSNDEQALEEVVVLAENGDLQSKEIDFVESLLRWDGDFTDGQRKYLYSIWEKHLG